MNKYKALVLAEVVRPILEQLKEHIDFEYAGYSINHEVLDHEILINEISKYDILISEYDTIDKAVFNNSGKLKIIVCCRGGVKSVVDLAEAEKRKIFVCNTAGRNAEAVSDMTLGYMLNMTRNISLANNLIHQKVITAEVSTKPKEYRDTVWGLDNNSPFIKYRGRSLNHMTLGIVGFGHAGRLVAKKACAFGLKILVHDPYVKSFPDNVVSTSFENLLKESDIVTAHCIVTPQTRGLFSKDQFTMMKSGSYFINTSRGELVNENDMIDALNSGHLSGAAIDVTAVEPISSDSPLLDAKNLIITPHIAGSSEDVQISGTNMIVESLRNWLENKKPLNCVVYPHES